MSVKVFISSGCPHGTTTRYRCTHLQEQLLAAGHQVTLENWYGDHLANLENILDHDLIVLHRVAMTPMLRQLLAKANQRRIPLVFDTDDLIFEPMMTEWHRGVRRLSAVDQALYGDGVQRQLEVVEAADYVTVATPLLADIVHRRGKAAFVHRNALGNEMSVLAQKLYQKRGKLPFSVLSPNRTVIGYGSGTPTHDVDFEVASLALVDILTRFPNVELWLVGPLLLPPILEKLSSRIRRFELVEWDEWFKLVCQFDINLAPLEMGNLFCRSKSEIKFVEAGALGVPTLASRIDPYEQAIVHGENGMLAGDLFEWIQNLETLITQPELRVEMGKRARESVEQHYSPTVRAQNLADLLPKLLEKNDPPTRSITTSENKADGITNNTITNSVKNMLDISAPSFEPAPFVPLTINWLINVPTRGSGGHTTIFRIVRHLVELGHECHLYVQPTDFMTNYSAEEMSRYVDENFMPTGARFHRWLGFMDEADVGIATYWTTVYDLLDLSNIAKKYYFVQDFEPYFFPVGTEWVQAEESYRRGLHCLTIGSWLADMVRTRFNATADAFDFGVDSDVYKPALDPGLSPALGTSTTSLRICFYARPSTPRRAYELGIEALRRVKARYPASEIILFGAKELFPVPQFAHVNRGVLTPPELAELFASCAIGVVFSLTNLSLIPLEMMACKCAVVEMRGSQTEWLLKHRQTAMLTEPKVDHMANAIIELMEKPTLRTQIAEQGYQRVSQMKWRESARQVETVLLRHAPPPQERVVVRKSQAESSEALLWQLHQLVDRIDEPHTSVEQWQATVIRLLEEKADLTAQLRQSHKRWSIRGLASELKGSRKLLDKAVGTIRTKGVKGLFYETLLYFRWRTYEYEKWRNGAK